MVRKGIKKKKKKKERPISPCRLKRIKGQTVEFSDVFFCDFSFFFFCRDRGDEEEVFLDGVFLLIDS